MPMDQCTFICYRRLIFYFALCSAFAAKSQTYAFDSVLIGKYIVKTEAYVFNVNSLVWTCNDDTLIIDEDIYPNTANFLRAKANSCHGSNSSTQFVKYYADTSFTRYPGPCDCFDGKYYNFNDSLKITIRNFPFYYPYYYYVYYGRKFWSPVTGYVGLKNHSKELGFEVYPNPSSSSISVVFANGYLPEQLRGQVMDMAGNEVMDFNLSDNTATGTINTSALKAGVYTIKINDYDKVYIKRVVIIR